MSRKKRREEKRDVAVSAVSLERLKEKIDSVTTNIAVYTDYMDRYKKTLKDEYDLNLNQAEARLADIEKESRALIRKERKLYKEASNILDEIEDEES